MCTDCGAQLREFVSAYSVLSPEQLRELTQKGYGRVLCVECARTRRPVRKEKK